MDVDDGIRLVRLLTPWPSTQGWGGKREGAGVKPKSIPTTKGNP